MSEEQKEKSVALVVYPGVSMLELTSAYSTLNGLKMKKYSVAIIAQSMEALASDTPLKIVPQRRFAELPNPTIMVVMGGGLAAMSVLANAGVRAYVRSAAAQAEHVIGVGAGSLLLATCGLLNNRPATTHWAFSGLLQAFGARYVQERWVEDGRFITTAGGTAGMDMGLQLLARLAGENNARLLQLMAEYDPQPPFGGIEWSSLNGRLQAPFAPHELEALRQSVAGEPEIFKAVEAWARPMYS